MRVTIHYNLYQSQHHDTNPTNLSIVRALNFITSTLAHPNHSGLVTAVIIQVIITVEETITEEIDAVEKRSVPERSVLYPWRSEQGKYVMVRQLFARTSSPAR